MRADKDDIVMRGPDDLDILGPYVRTRRKRAGMTHSGEAAPFLGVGARLLVQLEAGTRGTRGVSLSKLLSVLQGLGLELVIRPRRRTP